MNCLPNAMAGALLAVTLCACGTEPAVHDHDHQVAAEASAHEPEAPVEPRLFMDVHHLGAHAVTVDDVAGAHQKDLAVQAGFGVDYQAYWVDQDTGTIYCLVEAPDAALAHTVHKEAHGLLADELVEVEPALELGAARGTGTLFMATHLVPRGNESDRVAGVYRDGAAAAERHGVTLLRFWQSARTGRSHCLIEAPDRAAAAAFYAEVGSAPQVLNEVVRGR